MKKEQPKEMQISEEMKSNARKAIDEKLAIIKSLNAIKYPLNVTVFSHGKPWSIRNESFWKEFKKGDEGMIKFMMDFLSEEK